MDIRRIVVVSALTEGGKNSVNAKDIAEADVMLTPSKERKDLGKCGGSKCTVVQFLEAGRVRTLRDLYLVKDAIARKVEDKGYFLATTLVPPQKIARGRAELGEACTPIRRPADAAPAAEVAQPVSVDWGALYPPQGLYGFPAAPAAEIRLRPPPADPRTPVAVNWDALPPVAAAGRHRRVHLRPPPAEVSSAVAVNWEALPPAPVPADHSPVHLHPPKGVAPVNWRAVTLVRPEPPRQPADEAVGDPPTGTACLFIVKGRIEGKVMVVPDPPAGDKSVMDRLFWTAHDQVQTALENSYGPNAKRKKEPTIGDFESAVLRINDWPGISAQTVLTAAQKTDSNGKLTASQQLTTAPKVLQDICLAAEWHQPEQAPTMQLEAGWRQPEQPPRIQLVAANTVIPAEAPAGVMEEPLNLSAVAERNLGQVFGGIDNRNSAYVGRWTGESGAEVYLPGFANMYSQGERLEARYKRGIITDRLSSWSVTGDFWLRSIKTSVSHGQSYSQPGSGLTPLQLVSDTQITSIYFSTALRRSRENNVTVRLGGEAIDSSTAVAGNNLVDDRLRVLRGGITWDTTWLSWSGAAVALMADIEASSGFDLLHASPRDSIYLSREHGRTDFTKVRGSISAVIQPTVLPNDWSFYLGGSGQWGASPLLVTEEFGIGGKDFGRAFDPAAFTGDHGFAVAIEPRWSHTFLIPNFPVIKQVDVQPYLFFDVGRVWQIFGDTGIPNASVASTGFGVRGNTALPASLASHVCMKRLTLSLDVQGAKAMMANVSTPNSMDSAFAARFFMLSSLRGEF